MMARLSHATPGNPGRHLAFRDSRHPFARGLLGALRWVRSAHLPVARAQMPPLRAHFVGCLAPCSPWMTVWPGSTLGCGQTTAPGTLGGTNPAAKVRFRCVSCPPERGTAGSEPRV